MEVQGPSAVPSAASSREPESAIWRPAIRPAAQPSGTDWEEALRAFELVETTADHVQRARQVQRLLAAKHQRGRKVPDLLIAAAAE